MADSNPSEMHAFSDDSELNAIMNEQQVVQEETLMEEDINKSKRIRSDDEEEEFTIVERTKRRAARKLNLARGDINTKKDEEKFEAVLTSQDILPKQISMAKLLRSEDIQGVIQIKYKNPYKVLIEFESRIKADKLISCKKFEELGYRCRMSNELNICHGVIKNIDVGTDEKELLENFECEQEIISIRRLKRQLRDGSWVDSEVIKICFKGSTLPPYLNAYGCRFKIEQYKYPVTQCSGCWKFGHLVKSCPSKRIICPKCAGRHDNCTVEEYVCPNCNGDHMALDKTCPMFIKEKEIRLIMLQDNSTYKTALQKYLNLHKRYVIETYEPINQNNKDNTPGNTNSSHSGMQVESRTYRDVLTSRITTEATIHTETMSDEDSTQEDNSVPSIQKPKKES